MILEYQDLKIYQTWGNQHGVTPNERGQLFEFAKTNDLLAENTLSSPKNSWIQTCDIYKMNKIAINI